ncbi:MAG: ATP-binding protein, partial [Sporichthyaceae bacterium]|nr:ATP-binding protein [Sporichthyaceae bacterium]
MASRQPIDPAWWDREEIDGVPLRQALADRDIKTIFNFVHRRGWSWAAIAQATDIGEQRVREIASGRRRIENYDVYVRVAVGLSIPRDYLGVGLRPAGEPTRPTTTDGADAVVELADSELADSELADSLTSTVRSAIDRAVPAVADHCGPDLVWFRSEVMRAWAERRRSGHRDTNVVLVAGFAGSGKTEFARFLSGITGWALLDKDVLTRPMTEGMLSALGGDPNDRHTELYRTRVRPIEYRCLSSAAFTNVDNRVSTVVTAPFLAEVADGQWLRRFICRCANAGAHVEVVWVDADIDTMHTYLQVRDAARDTWKLNHWQDYLSSINLDLRPQV